MRRRPGYALQHPARQLPPSPTGSGSGGDQDKNSTQKESKKDDGGKHVTFGTTECFGYIQDEEEFSHNCEPSKIPAPIRGELLSQLQDPSQSSLLLKRSGKAR